MSSVRATEMGLVNLCSDILIPGNWEGKASRIHLVLGEGGSIATSFLLHSPENALLRDGVDKQLEE